MPTFNRERYTNLASMREWLESLPLVQIFVYADSRHCLFASWARECGMIDPACSPWSIKERGSVDHNLVEFETIDWMFRATRSVLIKASENRTAQLDIVGRKENDTQLNLATISVAEALLILDDYNARNAHMNQEKKAKIAAALKLVMPKDWKYSLHRDDDSITLIVASAPIPLEDMVPLSEHSYRESLEIKYMSLNTYYPEKVFRGKTFDVVKEAINTLNIDNYFIDYSNMGHYIYMDFGKWDKPFINTAENK